jgi:hypothetical protein
LSFYKRTRKWSELENASCALVTIVVRTTLQAKNIGFEKRLAELPFLNRDDLRPALNQDSNSSSEVLVCMSINWSWPPLRVCNPRFALLWRC